MDEEHLTMWMLELDLREKELAKQKAEAEEANRDFAQQKAEAEEANRDFAQRLAELERREQEQKIFMQARVSEEKKTPDEHKISQMKPNASEPKFIQMLNGWQASSQPFAVMEFVGDTTSSTSRSKNRSELGDVVLIEDFHENMQEFLEPKQSELESMMVKSFMPQDPFVAESEGDIQKRLNKTVYPTMTELLGHRASMLKSVAGNRMGKGSRADGYCVGTDPVAIVAVVEAKKPSLSACGDCLVKQVHDKKAGKAKSRLDSTDACEQAACYSIQAGTPYGFITTYTFLWCYFLDPYGIMHVSPGFPTHVSGLRSGFNVMFYWISKALAEDRRGWKLPALVRVSDGQEKAEPLPQPDKQGAARGKENESQQKPKRGAAAGRGGGKLRALATYNGGQRDASCPTGFLCCGAADAALRASPMPARDGLTAATAEVAQPLLLEALAEHRDRITWRALLPDGTLVVVKAYDCADDRDLEVECYDALQPLQGRTVPSLLRRRLLVEAPGPSIRYADDAADDPRVHAIVLSWAGPEESPVLAGPGRGLSVAALLRGRRVLRRLHSRGVVHGDVDPRNMAVHPASGRVVVYDFSHASTLASLGGDRARFSEACAEDMRQLDKHLARAAAAGPAAGAAVTRRAHDRPLLGLR